MSIRPSLHTSETRHDRDSFLHYSRSPAPISVLNTNIVCLIFKSIPIMCLLSNWCSSPLFQKTEHKTPHSILHEGGQLRKLLFSVNHPGFWKAGEGANSWVQWPPCYKTPLEIISSNTTTWSILKIHLTFHNFASMISAILEPAKALLRLNKKAAFLSGAQTGIYRLCWHGGQCSQER